MALNPEQLALAIDKRFHGGLLNTTGECTLVHVLGPPCTGKSLLRTQLFPRWRSFNPLWLSAGYWILPRKYRLENKIGECDKQAYLTADMLSAIEKLKSGQQITVSPYDHSTGRHLEQQIEVSGSDFIFLEGPAWCYISTERFFKLCILLSPIDANGWRDSYVKRNIKQRNYSIEEVSEAFDLMKESWQELTCTYTFVPHMRANVHFPVETQEPQYEIL